MNNRVTSKSIRVAEFKNYLNILKKSADHRNHLLRHVTLSSSYEICDELINFRCTGEIPHAYVIRSQRNKIVRCMIANFTLLRAHIYTMDEVCKLNLAINEVFEVYPYLYDDDLLNEFTRYYLYY